MKKICEIYIPTLLILFLLVLNGSKGWSQQHVEMGMSQYFRNKLIWNAAYTGVEGNRLFALQNRSWIGFDGAPILTGFSGEFNFGKNSALGAQFLSDKSGVLFRNHGIVNYSYRVKIDELQTLRLGVALSFNGERLDGRVLDGNIDPLINTNLNRRTEFDGNFGAVYQIGDFDMGISFNRIGNNIRNSINNNVNFAVSQIGISYKMNLSADEKFLMRSIAMCRIYRQGEPIFDIGAEFNYNETFHFMSVYQTIGNIRAGAGVRKNGLGELNFFYNTNNRISNNASQQYELGIGIYLKNRISK